MLNKIKRIIRKLLGRCEYCGGEIYVWDRYVRNCRSCGKDY